VQIIESLEEFNKMNNLPELLSSDQVPLMGVSPYFLQKDAIARDAAGPIA